MRVSMAMNDQSAHSKVADQQPRALVLATCEAQTTAMGRGNARLRALGPERPLAWFDRVWKGLVVFNLAFGAVMAYVALTGS